MNNEIKLISVVIPSIGGDLCDTLDSLNASSVYPDEIIICLPNKTHSVKDAHKYKNLTVIYAERYGQVYQRIVGFKQAKNDWVLQIDDDIILKENAIEKLIKCSVLLGVMSVTSPGFCHVDTNISLYKNERNSMIWHIIYWIANGKNGFQPGVISLSGNNLGLYFDDKASNVNESEWLPGGCVLHRKENLILEDYFPFKGKAYSEDIIHSFLLKKQGIRLYVCKDAIAYADITDSHIESWTEFVRQYKAAKYVSVLFARSRVRFGVYYLAVLMNFLFTIVKKPVRFI